MWTYYSHGNKALNCYFVSGLDGIVNNAGIVSRGLIEWQSIELMKKVFEINYWGTVRVVKVMLPLLKKSNGRVINMSSIAGIFFRF